MASKPSTVPGWVPVGTTPSAGQKTAGFATNGPLPAAWANWFWTLVSGWVAYLRDGVIVGEAGQPGLTITGGSGAGGKGLVVTAGGTNENAIQATPTGSGIGVKTSGTMNSALEATNTSSGRAVYALNTGGGTALEADTSGGSGYGAVLTGNATKAPLRITPQSAEPSSTEEGQLYYDSDTDKLRLYANGAWVDLN